jgi:cytochrome c
MRFYRAPRRIRRGSPRSIPTIPPNGDTMNVRRAVVVLASLAAVHASAAVAADAKGEDLIKKYGCTACHAVDKKIVGPAYKDVANKYRNDAKAAGYLHDKIKKGGSGVWGPVPMPPNTQVPDADVKAIVSWILSLK